MKCFHHPERDAVAVCKSCHRGLCPDCAADVPPGVACRGKCEDEVAAINLIFERSKTAYQKTGVAYRRNGMAILIMGLIFMAIGLVPLILSGEIGPSLIVLPLACVFLLMAFFNFRSGSQISK